ncbi:MAG TPA: pyridoxamine 5'-phosphate oxidase family protein [Nitrosopumilus sp.]|nr:pyridoxamine 5'-phosphate oxidase family protein [Nitrosopumilus sp.]HJM26099.1 pyridoxamine 5'-phosphate oxidase family protein [Nitrosopumilus sp.]
MSHLALKLLGKLEIKSFEKIKEFLEFEHVGRIASIDENNYPQIIPMNFVFVDNAIYMHSYPRGEKLENIKRNPKVGFEVDRELEFLPSYFSHPTNASQADTLYISVVIKGKSVFVDDDEEKALGLNAMMKKYQPEGHYDPIQNNDLVLDEVAVIKIIPESIKGKYKIGQHMNSDSRTILAQKILEKNSNTAMATLKIMGFEIIDDSLKMIDEPIW